MNQPRPRRSSTIRQDGFTLIESIIGLGVMALVITGGLAALGQATLLSEKSSKQVLADFVLRTEVEALRSADWDEVSSRHDQVASTQGGTSAQGSNSEVNSSGLIAFNSPSLREMGLTAEVESAELNQVNETGKIAFRILLIWEDKSGKKHEEARVLVITEGGLSADA